MIYLRHRKPPRLWTKLRRLAGLIFALSFLNGLLTGCCTTVVRSEADFFFLKHPEAKSKYAKLHSIPLEYVADQALGRFSSRTIILGHVYKCIGTNSFNGCLRDKDSALELARAIYEDEVKPLREVKEIVEANGGEVHVFETRQPPQVDKDNEGYTFQFYKYGLVVIRNGEIIKEVVLQEGKTFELLRD